MELGHQIDWETIECLEKEKRKIPRKILEGCHIKGNRDRCMNLNDGLNIRAQYGEGERAWVCRGRETKQEGHQINQSRASVVPERRTSNSHLKYSVNKVFKKTTACRRKTSWKSF